MPNSETPQDIADLRQAVFLIMTDAGEDRELAYKTVEGMTERGLMDYAEAALGNKGSAVVIPVRSSTEAEVTRLRKLVSEVAAVLDPDCPDVDAYVDGHCNLVSRAWYIVNKQKEKA